MSRASTSGDDVMQTTDPTTLSTQLAGLSSGAFKIQAQVLIEAAEANIARIESQIRDLEHLRDRERGIVTQLRMAIAPVNKLPAELLVEVFLLVCDNPPYQDRIRQTLALSQACAYWRRVAHSTPRLFREAVYNTLQRTPSANYLDGTKQWLGRSSPFPISVHLNVSDDRVQAEPLMDILATAAHRWKTADFRVSSLRTLSHISAASLSLLERLNLQSPGWSHHAEVSAFSAADKLRSVHLDTCLTSRFLLPWSQLTHMSIKDSNPIECLNALVQCTNIVGADFETNPWSWNSPPDIPLGKMTTLERLTSLSLDFEVDCQSGSCAPFFAHLALPALTSLTLCLMDSLWPSAEFTQFQIRSPHLEQLRIERSDLDTMELLTLFRQASSLISLTLECCVHCIDDNIFDALRYSPTATLNVVPKLTTFVCSYARNRFSEEALDNMIQSRWWTDQELSTLPPPAVSRWSCIGIHSDDQETHLSTWFGAKLEGYQSQDLDVWVQGYKNFLPSELSAESKRRSN
ncbi:F-box domain-containing protein [Favolaschia claudopus]|uniref:F-box domain-containing protein n=1 Tax=Favolaschia claudopus TaxID=2862362 RepID=A0AAW0BAX1_9AGAR